MIHPWPCRCVLMGDVVHRFEMNRLPGHMLMRMFYAPYCSVCGGRAGKRVAINPMNPPILPCKLPGHVLTAGVRLQRWWGRYPDMEKLDVPPDGGLNDDA